MSLPIITADQRTRLLISERLNPSSEDCGRHGYVGRQAASITRIFI